MKIRPATPAAYNLLHEGTLAFAQIESNGIRIDTEYLEETITKVGEEIRRLDDEIKKDDVFKEWRKRYGTETNLDSGLQMAHIVFNVLGHEQSHRSKELGKLTWDEATFADVDLPFIKNYFKSKKLKKAHSTYLKGIQREVYGGFLHPSFNLAGGILDDDKGGARTYRSSSSNPNFQNMPKRLRWIAEIIRKTFIAREGYHLGEIDYGQLEVRVAAFYHADPTMMDYLNDPTKDMHGDTAMELLGLRADQVSKYIRDIVKNKFVFPQFYGSYFGNCARDIWEIALRNEEMRLLKPGDDPKEPTGRHILNHLERQGIVKLGDVEVGEEPRKGTFAHRTKEIEHLFWNDRFPVYTKWKRDFFTEYQRKGFVRMFSGFVCSGLMIRNEVINYPVQGLAFHCLLQSLIWIMQELKRRKMRTRIVAQIHDSILADIHKNEVEDYFRIAKWVMTEKLPKYWKFINVPLEVEADMAPLGKSWYDKEKQLWLNDVSGLPKIRK